MRKVKGLYPLFAKHMRKSTFVGFDVETIGDTNIFYIGGLYEDNEQKIYDDKDEMIKDLLSEKYNGKVIVATNLAFDFNALFFDTEFWSQFETIFVGGQMICAIFQKDHFKIIFQDTFNFAPFSVETMGNILSIEKLEHPKCLGRVPSNEAELEELKIYNMRDCEISKKFMDFLQKGFNELGGEIKMTISSTAMNLFRRKYLRFPIINEKETLQDENIFDFIYESYYGGRTEAFSRGKLPTTKLDDGTSSCAYKCFDLNSLYPSCMLNEFPLPRSAKMIHGGTKRVFDFEGISEITFTTPTNMYYPFLPIRTKEKLLFPLGKNLKGTYTHLEIRKAISLGYTINTIHKSLIYRQTFYPFKDYVYDLYNKRMMYKKIKSPMELVSKLALVSLYGKFAEKNHTKVQFLDVRVMTEDEEEDFMFNEKRNIVMSDSSKGFELTKERATSSHIMPIFSSYVTSYGRIKLYEYISKYNAIYCDTDSIVTNRDVPCGVELGEMKIEYDILNGIIIRPKMYIYEIEDGFVVKMKGIPRPSMEKFSQILLGEKVTFKKFSKTKESLRSGIRPNTIKEVSKAVGLEDDKRSWLNEFDADEFQISMPRTYVQ